MSDDKKLSLKERLAAKKKLKSTGGFSKKPISKDAFKQKQEELKKQEEEKKRQEELEKKEKARKKAEEEARIKREEAERKRKEELKRLEEERQLKLKEQEAFLQAVKGETDAGEAPKSKLGIIIAVSSVIVASLIAYYLGGVFENRRGLNEAILQAKMALEIMSSSEKVLDDYDRYLRSHKGERFDLGAGKILGTQGSALLKGDEFTQKFQIYAGTLYQSAGKDMIRYANLLIQLIETSKRLNSILDKNTLELLEKLQNKKSRSKLNKDSLLTVTNSNYPLPDNKDYIIKMGELVEVIGLYEYPEKEAKKRKKRRLPLDDKLNVKLYRDSSIEFVIPKGALTPITDAYKYFQATKGDVAIAKYQAAYASIKQNWKDINSLRKRIKEALKKKANQEKYFTF